MNTKTLLMVCSWNAKATSNNSYYLPYCHYVYLKQASSLFAKVILLSSVTPADDVTSLYSLAELSNVEIISMPYTKSYLSAQKYFFHYLRQFRELTSRVDVVYCRVPDPFCWLPTLIFRRQYVIMDFVGSPLDVIRNNENWSKAKKTIVSLLYYPEYLLTLHSAKRSHCYCCSKAWESALIKRNIPVRNVIPSTIIQSEISSKIQEKTTGSKLSLVFTGYLRPAKGIQTILDLIVLLKKNNIDFVFHVIGDGEMMLPFAEFVKEHHLTEQVLLHGQIDNREEILSYCRQADFYIFPSLSEGMPRSVLEAMSQGAPVISTPVGSLPHFFQHNVDIIFADFNDARSFYDKIEHYTHNRQQLDVIRKNAWQRIADECTIESFFASLFATCLVR